MPVFLKGMSFLLLLAPIVVNSNVSRDAVGDGIATAAKKPESLGVPEGYVFCLFLLALILNSNVIGEAVGYGCGHRGFAHRCWKFCADGGRCWTYPQTRCYDDWECAGDPPCSGTICF